MSDNLVQLATKPATARVLAALARADAPLAVRELARLADVSADTASRVVRRLQERRETTVHAVGNRRLVQLRRTPPADRQPVETTAAQFTDPAYARRRRLPVRRIRAQDLVRLGWPARLPDVLLVPERWARHAKLRQPYVTFRRERPLQWRALRPEDVAVAFLSVNPLVTRALVERANLDRRRLRRRILEEGKVAEAALVHLDKVLRLPTPGGVERIPEPQIQRQLRQNPVRVS